MSSVKRATPRRRSDGLPIRSAAVVELLEDRTLLSTITLAAGQLVFTGSSGVAEELTVSVTGEVYEFISTETITVSSDDTGTAVGDGTNTVTIGLVADDVQDIDLVMDDLADTVTIFSTSDPLDIDGGGG